MARRNTSPYVRKTRLSLETLEARALPSFIAVGTYMTGINPQAVAVGDFNGDGIADLAVANQGSSPYAYQDGSVSVLLGNGDGTFQDAQTLVSGFAVKAVTVADVNNDGIPDVVAVGHMPTNDVAVVLLGNGDGTFQPPQEFSFSGPPMITASMKVVVADVNGDGNPDILAQTTVNNAASSLWLLAGNGDGTFQNGHPIPIARLFSFAVGDFNGDGSPDLAITDSTDVYVMFNNGAGTFQRGPTLYVGYRTRGVAVGDFNGDGIPNIAVQQLSTVAVFLGNGDGTFGTGFTTRASAGGAESLSAADINGDGLDDLLWGNVVLLSNGDGTFRSVPQSFSAVNAGIGDFNGDGLNDLAVPNGENAITVYLNDGNWPDAPRHALAVKDFLPDQAALSTPLPYAGSPPRPRAVDAVGAAAGEFDLTPRPAPAWPAFAIHPGHRDPASPWDVWALNLRLWSLGDGNESG